MDARSADRGFACRIEHLHDFGLVWPLEDAGIVFVVQGPAVDWGNCFLVGAGFSGVLVESVGYGTFFLITAAMGIPVAALVWLAACIVHERKIRPETD